MSCDVPYRNTVCQSLCVHFKWDRLLRSVIVFGAFENFQFGVHLAAQGPAWKHAFDRFLENAFWRILEKFLQGDRPLWTI